MTENSSLSQTSSPDGKSESWKLLKMMVDEMNSGKYSKALEIGEVCLHRSPSSPAVLYNLGLTYFNLARYKQAAECYVQALHYAPKDPKIYNNLSSTLLQGGDAKAALRAADEALRLKPDYHLAMLNRANALLIIERVEEALLAYDKALQSQPSLKDSVVAKSMVDLISNQGVAFYMAGDFQRALERFDRALNLNPWAADVRFNRACCLLLQGDFERGFVDYESRWERHEMSQDRRRHPIEKQWNGKHSLVNKIILIWAEQGFGDTIQFSRYLSMVKSAGGKVVFELQPQLKDLLSQLKDVDEFLERGGISGTFDFHCPLMSLPKIFNTRPETIPVLSHQIVAHPDKVAFWRALLGIGKSLRLGIAWSGNSLHTQDRTRSMGLQQLRPLMHLGCEVICIQKEVDSGDHLCMQELGIKCYSEHLKDFSDTAALIECLDFVVTVDTAVAHLAGSMAKPTLLMLSKYPDWRWGLTGDSTRWYPSMRLIRQEIRGDWEDVVERVASHIRFCSSVIIPIVANRAGEQLTLTVGVTDQQSTINNLFKDDHQRAKAQVNLGDVLRQAIELYQSGQPERAEPLARQVLVDTPDNVDAINLVGVIAAQGSRYEEGEKLFERVIQLRPNFYEAHTNRGNALAQIKRFSEAIQCYESALQLNSNRIEAYLNLGLVYKKIDRTTDALLAYKKALDIDPKNANTQMSVGNILRELGDLESALCHYDRALESNPDYATALSNRAITLADLGRFDESLRDHNRACELMPDSGEARFNHSLTLLLLGKFKQGWETYEWRWKRKDVIDLNLPRHFSQPLWLGESSLEGKTILLWAEQGLGDTIQMVRSAQWLAARGARVILEVPKPLYSLVNNVEGAHTVLSRGDPLPTFDFHCPLLSIPLALSLTDQSNLWESPYIKAPPEKVKFWSSKLGSKHGLRIGLVWAGNPKHGSDRQRSVALDLFEPLLRLDAEFLSLQKDLRLGDSETLKKFSQLLDCGPDLNSFTDTAGLVENLDILVSVDTSVAHLAAAMGKPVALLVSSAPDWRWLLGRQDTPWYPSVRLFRQKRRGDWSAVIQEVVEALLPYTGRKRKSKIGRAKAHPGR